MLGRRILLSISALAIAQLLSGVEGHGRVTKPSSRVNECRRGGKNKGCLNTATNGIQNEGRFPRCPFGSMDGVIASGMMAAYRELDEQGADRWWKNSMKPGRNSFTWELPANHQTKDFRYFITKNGWNPNAPLQVSSFESRPFCSQSVNGKPPRRVTHQCNVPNRRGYHVVLAEWKIGDNTRSFYNVIDIDFSGRGGGGNGPAVVPMQPITRYHDRNVGGFKGFISKYYGKGRLCISSNPNMDHARKGWVIYPPLPCKVNTAQNKLQWNGNSGPAPRPQPNPQPRPPQPRPQPRPPQPRPQPRPPQPRPQPRPPQGCRWRVRRWGNCTKNNCCESGYRCEKRSRWYSQCRPARNQKPAPRPGNNGGCRWRVKRWGNCTKNPKCCASGSRCVRKNRWYSQCK